MGQCCSTGAGLHRPDKELTILLIGLDNSGKTTLAAAVAGEVDPVVVPTVGFSAPVRTTVAGMRLKLYDLGGGARIRGVWPNYFADVHGVVYVVDAAEPGRLSESATELAQALLHPMVVGKPVLIFANKQDLPTAMSAVEIATTMGLDKLATLCRHHVQACIARPGLAPGGTLDDRIPEGLTWLVAAIKADLAGLSTRRAREMQEFAAAEAERRAKVRAAYNEFKAREGATAAAHAAAATTAGGQAEASRDAAGEMGMKTPAARETKPPPPAAPAPILCTVCKTNPAVRKSAAAKWQPACQACHDQLEGRGKPQPAAAWVDGAPASGTSSVDAKEETAAGASGGVRTATNADSSDVVGTVFQGAASDMVAGTGTTLPGSSEHGEGSKEGTADGGDGTKLVDDDTSGRRGEEGTGREVGVAGVRDGLVPMLHADIPGDNAATGDGVDGALPGSTMATEAE